MKQNLKVKYREEKEKFYSLDACGSIGASFFGG